MFVQRRSFLSSLIIHLFLFLLLWGYFIVKTPPLPLLPQKRVVKVTVKSRTAERVPEQKSHLPALAEPRKENLPLPPDRTPEKAPEPEPLPPREMISEQPQPVEKTVTPAEEQLTAAEPPKEALAEPPLPSSSDETARDEPAALGENYAYSFAESSPLPSLEDPLAIPREDFSLDHLLIQDEVPQEGTDSLYHIELSAGRLRNIISTPDILFDMKDPVLGTLSDCRIAFSVTEEGLVRDIRMIPPGTGSETYDEILETLLSRFLFSPGEAEEGTIAINFSPISGASHD